VWLQLLWLLMLDIVLCRLPVWLHLLRLLMLDTALCCRKQNRVALAVKRRRDFMVLLLR
jgi:hypothetical protein